MKDSFVIHAEYIEDLPEENKAEFLMYIYNYGCKGIEPELKGLALTVWTKIKRRLDEDEATYNKKIKGNSAGGKKHIGNQYTRKKEMEVNGSDFQIAPTEWKSMEVNGSRGTEFVSVSDNESVYESEGESVKEPVPASESPSPSAGYAELQQNVYKKIQEHNKSVPVESKIPVSSSLLTFVQKEFRELLDVMRGSPPSVILQTVENLLKSAREQRKKKYSWYFFLKDINEYRPEYFQEKTGRPSDMSSDDFFNLMKDKPGFNMVLFCKHEQDWIKAGKPFDDAYFELQRTWEGDSVT